MKVKERLASIFGRISRNSGADGRDAAGAADAVKDSGSDMFAPLIESSLVPEDRRANFDRDMEWLSADEDNAGQRLQREAQKQVQTAVEDSVKQLHLLKMGRCPECNERLAQHLFAAICEKCGWKKFERPQKGPVRVHLRGGNMPIAGERCYAAGDILVLLKDETVVGLVPQRSVAWVEYVWTQDEIKQRYKQLIATQEIRCGWCNELADPEKAGFALVQVAFGTTQERYVFCSDACYEAFRKMYPSRVHRNCYERNCASCNLCVKRYEDETEGVRLLAKDFLRRKPAATG